MQSALESFCDVFYFDRFRGVVADSAGRAQEHHCTWNFVGEDHGVVASAAGHTVWLATCTANGFLNLIDKKRIHCDRALIEERALPESQAAAFGNFAGHSNQRP